MFRGFFRGFSGVFLGRLSDWCFERLGGAISGVMGQFASQMLHPCGLSDLINPYLVNYSLVTI